MDEKEFNNTYAIPANYTDSGQLLGGMLETLSIHLIGSTPAAR